MNPSATSDYQGLSIEARNILEHGVFVTKSEFYQVEVSLYKMDQEFVEVWYDTKREAITQIGYLKGHPINPFIKHISPVSLN
ncbi:MAG TPA: hypothetical protein DCE41_27635 [Cytophagales bacterium]|nr:hypothetical protein [Cytophagales bacterium]HAA20991.1 hypothetical protein [Cytophagales bacterium]HAP61524.1 hypothetical protein [Cytophagales bacterium]